MAGGEDLVPLGEELVGVGAGDGVEEEGDG